MILQGEVGPQLNSDGTNPDVRMGKSGELIVTELHGKYYEQGYRGNIFSACNQAAQAVSVALATTYTGILLYNPVGSGKILIPNKFKFALTVAPAAIASFGLIAGFASTGGVTAQTTPLTIQSSQIGNAGRGVGVALSAATIVTPTWLFMLQDGFTAAALPGPTNPIDLDGSFQIFPGAFIGFGALTAVTGFGSFMWEEVPF